MPLYLKDTKISPLYNGGVNALVNAYVYKGH